MDIIVFLMHYRPLAEVRKGLRDKWYRCPIETSRPIELSRRNDLMTWEQIGRHLLLMTLTAYLRFTFGSRTG